MPTKSSVGTISGFFAFPVQYDNDTRHMLYIRAHVGSSSKSTKKVDWPEDRTIFMVNVPPDATEREITLLFKSCGTVERVVFDADGLSEGADTDSGAESESDADEAGSNETSLTQALGRKRHRFSTTGSTTAPNTGSQGQRPKVTPLPVVPFRSLRRTGHTAHIVFLDASSCTRALALVCQHDKPIQWPIDEDDECPRGLAHYVSLYESSRPPLDAVREHADSAIARFDFDLAARKAALRRESKYKKGEALVDEDGFTLVVRGGAYGQAVGGGVGVASRKFMDEYTKGAQGKKKRRKPKEGKEKAAFYAFQIHEKKRNTLLELKRKWEQDKAAVEKLKSSRKFKAY
ncbi:ribosomal RNA-processing protein 7-domain-containing protein [Multifurca ochricompacta]|uniref:Ribosomal RNA-processing protein 7-domain-containing protein n=1 Tax=Multifurca ochricompacta TaxID=376703 RepID=A0AAD4MB27_9AGAM|nr:ribosomal RNA-processing protein 7-domain-containing protein [Multifurca ochricompacta]